MMTFPNRISLQVCQDYLINFRFIVDGSYSHQLNRCMLKHVAIKRGTIDFHQRRRERDSIGYNIW